MIIIKLFVPIKNIIVGLYHTLKDKIKKNVK